MIKSRLMIVGAALVLALAIPAHAGGADVGAKAFEQAAATAAMPDFVPMAPAPTHDTLPTFDLAADAQTAVAVNLVCHAGEIPKVIYVEREGPASARIRDGPNAQEVGGWPC